MVVFVVSLCNVNYYDSHYHAYRGHCFATFMINLCTMVIDLLMVRHISLEILFHALNNEHMKPGKVLRELYAMLELKRQFVPSWPKKLLISWVVVTYI